MVRLTGIQDESCSYVCQQAIMHPLFSIASVLLSKSLDKPNEYAQIKVVRISAWLKEYLSFG